MTKSEIEQYNELPDNLPDNTLTKKQQEFIRSLYNKYISRPIDSQSYYEGMYEVEKKESWPSGPRMKWHEAMRIILSNLVEQQGRKLTNKEAARKFHSAITCRPMYAKLLHEIYCEASDKYYLNN